MLATLPETCSAAWSRLVYTGPIEAWQRGAPFQRKRASEMARSKKKGAQNIYWNVSLTGILIRVYDKSINFLLFFIIFCVFIVDPKLVLFIYFRFTRVFSVCGQYFYIYLLKDVKNDHHKTWQHGHKPRCISCSTSQAENISPLEFSCYLPTQREYIILAAPLFPMYHPYSPG